MNGLQERTAEILKKIRTLEIKTKGLVETVFAGNYHSVFKGRGMNFEDVREYQPGDEIRAIDWNVTARLGNAFVKKFTEERELTVMLIVDVSASGNFGSTTQSKRELRPRSLDSQLQPLANCRLGDVGDVYGSARYFCRQRRSPSHRRQSVCDH